MGSMDTTISDEADQDAVIEFLSRPETFGVDEVARTTTSISEIFFAGDYVYKLKRAVSLPYVDFLTRTARRETCEREIRLNRRTAPGIYKRVVAVTEADGQLALDGDGPAVDYLVEMVRFDEDTLFDRLAARDELNDGLIVELADGIADLHRQAEPRPDLGGPDSMRTAIDNVIKPVRDLADAPVSKEELDRLESAWMDALETAAPRLAVRRRRGCVRQCHGDLHLANICLFEGSPTPFDCIEFNDAIACVDTAYDAAFPVMDLVDHGERGLANLLFNRYLAQTQDYHALPLWPLYLSARAVIRAMVTTLSAEDDDKDAHDAARRYLKLAEDFLTPQSPRLVAVGGRSGTGKSTLARHLAPFIGGPAGAVWLRTDILRKKIMGLDPEEKLPEDAYRPEVSAWTYRRMMRIARRALRAGWPVVLDAVFLKPEERDAAETVADHAGVPFTGLWLEAPLDLRIERATGRKADASDADAAVVRQQEQISTGEIAWETVDVSEWGPALKAARQAAGI